MCMQLLLPTTKRFREIVVFSLARKSYDFYVICLNYICQTIIIDNVPMWGEHISSRSPRYYRRSIANGDPPNNR